MSVKINTDKYLRRIIEKLIELDVKKILLFGSYINGNQKTNSDIDLLVVLNEDFLPQTYEEWLDLKMKVRRALREINNEVAIDLLVYTIPQYDMIKQHMNSFQREIHETGKILYEKAS